MIHTVVPCVTALLLVTAQVIVTNLFYGLVILVTVVQWNFLALFPYDIWSPGLPTFLHVLVLRKKAA